MSALRLPGQLAVLDVETTGLFPRRHDRVIEVAAVVVGLDGAIEREFVTLVNPERDIGPSSIHGLTSEDIISAPRFREVAGLIVDVLQGTLAIAAHNLRFDRLFLVGEFSRLGCEFPDCFGLCTLELAGGGKLEECCRDRGVGFTGDAHSALNDARATAHLLLSLLADQPNVVSRLTGLPAICWPRTPRPLRKPVTRDESRRRRAEPPTYLQRLFTRLSSHPCSGALGGPVLAYIALLDRVLEDRHIDESEGDALLELAVSLGMSEDQVRLVHSEYLDRLAIAALADGVVSDAERRDLHLVARLLGLEGTSPDRALDKASRNIAKTKTSEAASHSVDEGLLGKSVCFTGEMQCRYDGQVISRELAEELARKVGLDVVDSVTKKLDLLVVSDPRTQSGKARKARRYGIRIMHEPVFWKAIGVNVQ